MSSVYVPTPVALVNVTEPLDGELRSVASVTAMTRAIADGVAFNNAVRTPLATLAALAAIAAPADGTMRFVRGQGVFVFDSAASLTISPFTIAASDATPGMWVSATAHETSVTRWIPASYISGVSGTASGGPATDIPSCDPIGFVSTGIGAAFRAGLMKVGLASTSLTNAYGFQMPIDEFLIDGSTIASATLLYRPTAHGATPLQQPRFGLIRMPKAGPYTTIPTTLLSTGGGLVQDSGGTYVSDRALLFTPNQNNVVNRSLYSYCALIWDEHSTNAVLGNGYAGVSLAMTTVLDARR